MQKIISSYVIFSMILGTVGFLPVSVQATNNNENKVNICHQTSSESNSWVAQNINENALETHLEHGDFLYNGPIDDGKPDNTDGQADTWCENNSGETPEVVLVDVCPNLEGAQESMPEGYELSEENCVPVVPPVTTATLIATKIVCDSETDLPNFGDGVVITESTANDFLAGHPNCHLASGWNFQWAPDGTENPGSSMIGEAGNPWITFGQTLIDGTASTSVPAGSLIWVREVLKEGYVPFSDNIGEPLPENPVSAEIYCTTDGYNYDNYDWITPVMAGSTYNCVAFNAPIAPEVEEPTDVCPNIDGNQATLPEGMIMEEGSCVTPVVDEPTDVCPNIEGNQATLPEGKVIAEGNCVDQVVNPPAVPATPPANPGPTGNGGGNGPIVGSFGASGSNGGGQVLGASCSVYLNDYLRFGRNNKVDEVKKLQTFLNEYLKINLSVSGIFDQATFDAVKQFQIAENSEVIGPWAKLGLLKDKEATGYVYKTTKRRINMIKCADLNLPMPNLLGN